MSTKNKQRAAAIAKAREIKKNLQYAKIAIILVIASSPIILFSIFGY